VVSSMLTIEFNGKEEQIDASATILDLLQKTGVEPKFCAVELNLEILPKHQYASRRIHEGDRIEVVTLVGGG
jgi:sulfur carrier protein